jgi:hypothetical protein
MGITRFSCPACAAALKLGRALEPGRRFKCPRCAAVVTVPAAEAGEREPESPPRPTTGRQVPPPTEVADAGASEPKRPEEWERKRRKKSKKQKTNPALFWGLVGGGAAVVLGTFLIVVLSNTKGDGPEQGANQGGGGPKQPAGNANQGGVVPAPAVVNKPPTDVIPVGIPAPAVTNKLLTGEWESAEGPKFVLEFTGEGKVHLSGAFAPLTEFRFAKPLKMYSDFGQQPGRNLGITYRCVSDTRLEIKANYLPLLEKLSAGATTAPKPEVIAEYTPTETLTYAVTEKELTLTNDQGKILRLRRVG